MPTPPTARDSRLALILSGAFAAAVAIAALVLVSGTTSGFELLGVATANRTLNQLTAVVLTCMALIVPLTSNLYTPKLVRLYVTHPLIVLGLSVLLLSNLLVMAASFFPPEHPLAPVLIYGVSACMLVVLVATLPFLYGISQFLRPSYFLPMLTRTGTSQLHRLARGRGVPVAARGLFDTIDVVTNIALTGMTRGDRQLVLLALHSLHTLLIGIIRNGENGNAEWRGTKAYFVPGLAREGQAYLTRERIWPEAYMLAQMLKVMEVASKRQHEILAELASQLVVTAQLALAQRREPVIELHVMAFNTLMREAIDERDLRRFQNVSYYYRILIEGFGDSPVRLQRDAYHLVHYGRLAASGGLGFGLETVIYDMGELVLSIGRRSEAQALSLLENAAGTLFRPYIAGGGVPGRICWRTVIRLYWEARAANLTALADQLQHDYLRDDAAHREQIERALGENRELHFEFNDRLMRFAHLSPQAEAQARAFSRAV